MGRLITDETRLKYPEQLYLKSPAGNVDALGQLRPIHRKHRRHRRDVRPRRSISPSATPRSTESRKDRPQRPPAIPPPNPTLPDDERYLRQLCEDGLKWRYGDAEVSPDIRNRLDYELKVITAKISAPTS